MSRHVVIVDDNFDLLDAVCRSLRSQGFVVTTVHDVGSDLDVLRYPPFISVLRPPDVFLIAMDMRNASGPDVARWLHQGGHSNARMIAIAGCSEQLRQALQSGLFHGVLTKPFDLAELMAHSVS
jgi:CheY-like chemotaxis protein